jgi:hypothetical protein
MSAGESTSSRATVAVGNYELDDLGSPEGAFALYTAEAEEENARRLAQALAAEGEERDSTAPFDELIEDAQTVTGRCEKCVRLFNELAQGKALDPKVVSEEIDSLLELLGRLDRVGRHREALRLARDVSALLALFLRWLELVRSLRLALRLASSLGDPGMEAWALHQLGTLRLAAGVPRAAAGELEDALEIRRSLGLHGLCASRHNLDACRRDLALEQARMRASRRRRFRLVGGGALLALLASGGVGLAIAVTRPAHRPPIAASTPLGTSTPSSSSSTKTNRSSSTGATSTSSRSSTGTTTGATAAKTDTTPPQLTLVEPADGSVTNDPLVTFSGTAGTASGDHPAVSVYLTDAQSQPVPGSPLTASRNGASFSASTGPLADGSYRAYAIQSDRSGNRAQTSNTAFTVDTVAPTVSLTCSFAPGSETCSGRSNDTTQPVLLTVSHQAAGSGAGTTPATFQEGPVQPDAQGSFSFPPVKLALGEDYTFVASQTDAAGNMGQATASLSGSPR